MPEDSRKRMLIDELHEQLKLLEPDVAIIAAYWKNSKLDEEFQTLETASKAPDFWQQTEQLKKLQRIKLQREQYNHVMQSYKQIKELIELFATDEEELKIVGLEI